MFQKGKCENNNILPKGTERSKVDKRGEWEKRKKDWIYGVGVKERKKERNMGNGKISKERTKERNMGNGKISKERKKERNMGNG